MTLIDDLSSTARAVLAEVGGSLVTIGRDGRGSGIVIAAGRVLTNAHNLRDRTTLVTFADGRAEQGTVTGSDEDGDLVVLEVDTGDVSPAAWAEQMPAAGDMVLPSVVAGIALASPTGWCRPSMSGSTAHTDARSTAASSTPLPWFAVRQVARSRTLPVE